MPNLTMCLHRMTSYAAAPLGDLTLFKDEVLWRDFEHPPWSLLAKPKMLL